MDLFHVVLIPRLMASRWQRHFNKVCDFSFVISPSPLLWPVDMFKPMWVEVVLPFTHCRPWSLKQALLLVEMGRGVRRMLKTGEEDAWNILQKLLQLPKQPAPCRSMWHAACYTFRYPGVIK